MARDISRILLCFFLSATLGWTGCANSPIEITDAKMAFEVNEKILPVRVTSAFPSDTKTVHCWFQWKNAQTDTKITASWRFTTDDIHIIDYDFVIPRKEGAGSVALSMPETKTLPTGSYRVDLLLDTRKLRSLTFKVE